MAPSIIHDLCERYERNRDAYRSDAYNEAQARQEFINPLFKQLGWDMDNEQGYAEAYKDVVHEDSLRVGTQLKAPDYGFRIGGQRKFFLEAKKPRVSVVDSKDPAYQLRRYAWSAKLPLSVLTNFAEFAVYDCRWKPEVSDPAGKHRVEYFTFEQLAAKWEYLTNTFSREAILKGSFDKYAQGMKGKRGTQEVDSEFLKEIELWREVLARNLKLRNKDLSIEALNFSVGRIIDRIIFLRVCEDRGIEEYGQLEALLRGPDVYKQLVKLFKRADERYNSGLFHFQKEKGRGEQPDTLTPGLAVDDKILKDVLRTLYYPQSPYEFRVFPADILGQVYEQFLGKVIVKSGKTVDVEEKPEVRKAGGVYYTPTYIVDYIVQHTVGKLVEGKTPEEVAELRVLDPACGSGSFLIGAYQYLLDWHLTHYVGADGNPPVSGKRKAAKALPVYESAGGWRLTLAERRRILLNNIYGVDIDAQAVEVTKLSLLLKVLEGANAAEVQGELALRHHALPDLGGNIKCGNSLVGPDILQASVPNRSRGKQTPIPNPSPMNGGRELTDEEIARINPFDWQSEFRDVFKQGGFDAVIGNPPYGAEFGELDAEYYKEKYRVYRGVRDSYVLFMELCIRILNKNGKGAFIVPSAWIGGPEYARLREFVLGFSIEKIVLLPFDVFKDAYVDTLIFVLSNTRFQIEHRAATWSYGKKDKLTSIEIEDAKYDSVLQQSWVSASDRKIVLSLGAANLVSRMHTLNNETLSTFIAMKRGVLFDQELLESKRRNKSCFKYFEGDVYRYQINIKADKWVEFGDKMTERPKESVWFEGHRILLRRLVNRQQRLMAALCTDDFISNKNLYSILTKSDATKLEFLLGILNSKLVSYLYLQQVSQATKDDFPQVTIKDVLGLPAPSINFSDKADKARHDKMVKLVERMLELNKKLPEVKVPGEREKLERQIAATDREIDLLVYELYGLTEEEIAIVEGRLHS